MSVTGVISGLMGVLAGRETMQARQTSEGSAVARGRDEAIRAATIDARTRASEVCRSQGYVRAGELMEPRIASQKNIQLFTKVAVIEEISCAKARELKPKIEQMYGRTGPCEVMTMADIPDGTGYSITISIEYFCEK